MNRADHFARQICHLLDRGLDELDPDVIEQLRAARWRALERQPLRARAPAFAISNGDGAAIGGGGHFLRTLLALCVLLAGIVLAYHWNGFEQADANATIDAALLADDLNAAIDAALLADDLPPKAYLDPGFRPWLSHYAQFAR